MVAKFGDMVAKFGDMVDKFANVWAKWGDWKAYTYVRNTILFFM